MILRPIELQDFIYRAEVPTRPLPGFQRRRDACCSGQPVFLPLTRLDRAHRQGSSTPPKHKPDIARHSSQCCCNPGKDTHFSGEYVASSGKSSLNPPAFGTAFSAPNPFE